MSDEARRLSHLQERIEFLRSQKGLSMRELSLRAGLNETAVKAIMQGRSESPRGKTIQAIAHALGTTVQELIGPGSEHNLSPSSPSPSHAIPPHHDTPIEAVLERERQLERELLVSAARLEEVREFIALLRLRDTPRGTNLVDLLIEMIQAIMSLTHHIPEIQELGASAVSILQTGTVTAEQEAAIRAQLDVVKAKINRAREEKPAA